MADLPSTLCAIPATDKVSQDPNQTKYGDTDFLPVAPSTNIVKL